MCNAHRNSVKKIFHFRKFVLNVQTISAPHVCRENPGKQEHAHVVR